MSSSSQHKAFYAMNLFDVTDVDKYLAYFSRLPEIAPQYGARFVAVGRYLETMAGELAPRQVMLVVEWASESEFKRFLENPELADLHPLREDGTAAYIWQTFDGVDLTDPAAVAIDDILAMLKP
jgi:uncharacterized protein (DUF1330 family)